MRVGVRGLTVRIGNVTILQPVDLDVEDGEFFALLGPSGCGKTTFLRVLAGLERPASGRVWIGDQVVSDADGVFLPPEARDVGFVFQSYALWPHMTVYENVAFPLKARRWDKAKIPEQVDWALRMVGLAHLSARPVTALSGGQQQRVAIARAIVSHPKLLLMDEPLSNLDADLRREVRDEIRRLQQELQITTLYVTHDQEEAFAISDRIAVMNAGQILQVGSAKQIYDAPQHAAVAHFLGLKVLQGELVRDGGQAALEINGSRVPCAVPDALPEGPVDIALDAGKLHVWRPRNPSDDPPEAALPAFVERVAFSGRWGWRARVRLWEEVALELYTPAELQERTEVLLVGEPGFLRVVGPVAATAATAATN